MKLCMTSSLSLSINIRYILEKSKNLKSIKTDGGYLLLDLTLFYMYTSIQCFIDKDICFELCLK